MALTEQGASDLVALRQSEFFASSTSDGHLLPLAPTQRSLPIEHLAAYEAPLLPFVTDPSEWSFEMRKDAALVTLSLARRALADGLEMKDGTSFNVLFDGCRPVFVDHGSFRAGYSGHWPGYSQFGDHFMNPLLVEAHAGIPPNRLLRGVGGLPTLIPRQAPGTRWARRPGRWSWVNRRHLAERTGRRTSAPTSERIAAAELPKNVVDSIMSRAEATVRSLESRAASDWGAYGDELCPYRDEERLEKRQIIARFCEKLGGDTALDVGANTGEFTEIASRSFSRVISIDSDPRAIDRLYRRGSVEPWGARVQPAVVDIADPTPPFGWGTRERAGFLDRLGRVDLSLWLAVVHHLTLGAGIPIEEVATLVRQVSAAAIIEFVAPDDQSVRRMTAGQRWAMPVDRERFFHALAGAGLGVEATEALGPTRELVLVTCD